MTAPESVWDYPRPPAVQRSSRRVRVIQSGITVVDTTRAVRILETSHPPTWYMPFDDLIAGMLEPESGRTFCEFKGQAAYWSLVVGNQRADHVAWSYPNPAPGYEGLTDHFTVYPSRVDRCLVDDEQVQAQKGDFYGGWITSDVMGPFKGEPGTHGW